MKREEGSIEGMTESGRGSGRARQRFIQSEILTSENWPAVYSSEK